MDKNCKVPDCDRPFYAKGLCNLHYNRRWRTGSTDAPKKLSKRRRFIEDVAMPYSDEKCLVWPFSFTGAGYASGGGYPQFSIGRRRKISAHRFICQLTHGPAPSDEHQAAHDCGNSRCVNPRHLRWKTPSENMSDTVRHQTHKIGEANPNAKITAADVVKIFEMSQSMTRKEIAGVFGLSSSQISFILNRKRWTEVEIPDHLTRS